ncbi:hypothetical protein BH10PSE14_BH10PSE14_04490 [soil metagenome]
MRTSFRIHGDSPSLQAQVAALMAPPSAFSVRKGEPGYLPYWRQSGPRFDVLLDGVTLAKVVAYDCDAGWVRRLQTDADGRYVINSVEGTLCCAEETLTGTVTVAWSDRD